MKTTGASYNMTANHFGISETGTIADWKAVLMADGVEALFRPKGRPQKQMKKSKLSKRTKILTREQQLEEEIKLLRIENEYLKRCHAHGITQWDSKNQIETKVVQELTNEFKLADILKVTKIPKSAYYY